MIAGDCQVARSAYRQLIEAQADMRVVAEASRGMDVFQKASVLGPDVLLIDLHSAATGGIDVARMSVERLPDVRVLLLIPFDQPEAVRAAIMTGAVGLIVKNSPLKELLRAIRLIYSGKGVLSPEITAGVIEMLRGATHEPVVREVEIGLGAPVSITQRESDVLHLIAMGKSNSEIAEVLYLAPTSIKTYVSRIRAKLKARTRAELVTLYFVNSRIAAEPSLPVRRIPVFRDRTNEPQHQRRAEQRS